MSTITPGSYTLHQLSSQELLELVLVEFGGLHQSLVLQHKLLQELHQLLPALPVLEGFALCYLRGELCTIDISLQGAPESCGNRPQKVYRDFCEFARMLGPDLIHPRIKKSNFLYFSGVQNEGVFHEHLEMVVNHPSKRPHQILGLVLDSLNGLGLLVLRVGGLRPLLPFNKGFRSLFSRLGFEGKILISILRTQRLVGICG